jgi:UDP-N-acetyl-D-glucosamine dehydrogenase
LDIIHLLARRGAVVSYSDPYIDRIRLDGIDLTAENVERAVPGADCVVIVTDHSAFDYDYVLASAQLIVDTRHALKGLHATSSATVVTL